MMLESCVTSSPNPSPTSTWTVQVTPYIPLKPTATLNPASPPWFKATHLPTPTPTPQVYTVEGGDTLLGIALRFGITLEEILEANPDLNPAIISIGTKVIIPYVQRTPAVTPEPTPLPLYLDTPKCYPSSAGMWCFILVHNHLQLTIENIFAAIHFFNREGELLAEGTASPPLDLLESGMSIPLVFFYPEEIDQDFIVQAELTSALPAAKVADRYLNPVIESYEVEISTDGLIAQVSGIVGLPKVSLAARAFSILVIAYDDSGQVVGFRKSELNTPFAQGTTRLFELIVYSLGPLIEHVEIYAEARP